MVPVAVSAERARPNIQPLNVLGQTGSGVELFVYTGIGVAIGAVVAKCSTYNYRTI